MSGDRSIAPHKIGALYVDAKTKILRPIRSQYKYYLTAAGNAYFLIDWGNSGEIDGSTIIVSGTFIGAGVLSATLIKDYIKLKPGRKLVILRWWYCHKWCLCDVANVSRCNELATNKKGNGLSCHSLFFSSDPAGTTCDPAGSYFELLIRSESILYKIPIVVGHRVGPIQFDCFCTTLKNNFVITNIVKTYGMWSLHRDQNFHLQHSVILRILPRKLF